MRWGPPCRSGEVFAGRAIVTAEDGSCNTCAVVQGVRCTLKGRLAVFASSHSAPPCPQHSP